MPTPWQTIDDVVAAISTRLFHFGPVGYGTRFKLVLNALQAIHILGFGEAMAMARAAGLDPDDVGPALVERLGGPVTQMAWASDQQPPERTNFALALALKDLRYAGDDGRRCARRRCSMSRSAASLPPRKRDWVIGTGRSSTP